MPRRATLLGSDGHRPQGTVTLVRKTKRIATIQKLDARGKVVGEEKIATDRILDDGGKAWDQHQGSSFASFVSFDGTPQGVLRVVRCYKNVIKAKPRRPDGSWGPVEDFHPEMVFFDRGKAGELAQASVQPPMGSTGQRVGYVRVSTIEQNADRQLEELNTSGVVHKIFQDQISGSARDRPQLAECLNYLREGDELVVHSIDRLARSLKDLREIVDGLTEKGVSVTFLKERLTFSKNDTDPQAMLMLGVLGAFAEFERAIIRERQAEGIAVARKAGKYKGRKKALTHHQEEEVRQRVAAGESKSNLAREYGVARGTIYKAINTLNNK